MLLNKIELIFRMRFLFLSLFSFFSFTNLCSQQITLSDNIGEVNNIKFQRLVKSIGTPDTLIDQSYPKGKVKPNIKVIYGEHEITFNFFPKHKLVKPNQTL